MADNARQGLAQHRIKWLGNQDIIQQAMAELEEELSLAPAVAPDGVLRHLSHTRQQLGGQYGGLSRRASPKRSQYRRFKVKTVEGVDDFESMREVLRRRFKRMAAARNTSGDRESAEAAADTGWAAVPDLVLIDGGKGQLSAALEVMLELGLDDIPLASLAKENEWLFVPHTPEPIILPRTSQALYLVQRMRDEAHRFAITYHRNLRSKSSLGSPIDLVSGIGRNGSEC